TTARVLATALTGLSLATGGTIVDTDTVLAALGKLQNQISGLWNGIKGASQTITGALWSFVDIRLTGQAASGSDLRPLYIDSNGDVKMSQFINIDELNKHIETVAKSTLNTEFAQTWKDSEDRLIARLSNGRFLELGGDAAFLNVHDNVAAGAAAMRFLQYLSGSGLAYRIQDKNGNSFIQFRNLLADGVPDRAVLLNQKIEINQ